MMSCIKSILAVPGLNGFYHDDQTAIRAGAKQDGMTYIGDPKTPGFGAIRQPGEALCLMVVSEDGNISLGDCTSVQYPGVGGREPFISTSEMDRWIQSVFRPHFERKTLGNFRELVGQIPTLGRQVEGIPAAVRYGLSQALLHAVALDHKSTMAEIILKEYGLETILEPIPIYVQTGDERWLNADKAILKRAEVLPHGSFNELDTKVGRDGELLLEYLSWLVKRIQQLAGDDYCPTIHIDVYGTPSLIFGNDLNRIAEYLSSLAKCVEIYPLQVEAPVYFKERQAHLDGMYQLRNRLKRINCPVRIIADEWCNSLEDVQEFAHNRIADIVHIKTPDMGEITNTIEAVLACRETDVDAFLGGSCTDTDQSARVSVHIALATRPIQMLAKPGMDIDVGLMIVRNEILRALTIMKDHEQSKDRPSE